HLSVISQQRIEASLSLNILIEVRFTRRPALIFTEDTLLTHFGRNGSRQQAKVQRQPIILLEIFRIRFATVHYHLLFSARGFSPVSQYQAGGRSSVRLTRLRKKYRSVNSNQIMVEIPKAAAVVFAVGLTVCSDCCSVSQ